jgi:preprotein translocase subunit YajC
MKFKVATYFPFFFFTLVIRLLIQMFFQKKKQKKIEDQIQNLEKKINVSIHNDILESTQYKVHS